MRIRVVAVFIFLSACTFGSWAEVQAQGGPRAPRVVEHRVSVVVPVIITLMPPDSGSPGQAWRVRTNDPHLRKRFTLPVRSPGDTLRVTLTTP